MTGVGQALAAVMAELPNIGKGDRSPEGYQYRGIEAVTKHVQPLFAKHGVVVSPKATITDVRPSPAMKEGWQDVYMTVEWTITGPDGSTITAQTTGIGRDRADKGANKAQTQAFKYLLLHLLCIADGKDDSDGQTYEQDRAEPAAEPERLPLPDDLVARLDALSVEAQDRLATWASRAGEPDIRSVPESWVPAVERAIAAEEKKAGPSEEKRAEKVAELKAENGLQTASEVSGPAKARAALAGGGS